MAARARRRPRIAPLDITMRRNATLPNTLPIKLKGGQQPNKANTSDAMASSDTGARRIPGRCVCNGGEGMSGLGGGGTSRV